jgi:hypothetical protein
MLSSSELHTIMPECGPSVTAIGCVDRFVGCTGGGIMRLMRSSALLVVAAALGAGVSGLLAQPAPATRVFHVRETAGIRRTEYPVTARIPLPKGALRDPTQARILTNGAEVPAQYSAASAWDDGSVQALEIDFNASVNAEEDRRYELQYGEGVTPAPITARGLSVADQPDAVVVGNLKFSKAGAPLLASATYRGEGIGTGPNGLSVTDSSGRRHDLTGAQEARLEVVKPGPLLVVLRYTASLVLDEAASVPVEVVLEMPNSKTWLKTTATVTDRTRRLRDIAIERPYAFKAFPVVWDFGTDSGTYGVFRAATDVVTLTQTAGPTGATGWRIESGPPTDRRVLETSAGTRNRNASGWGHIQDAGAAVAFAIAQFGRAAGTSTITLAGSGQASYRFRPAEATTQHQLTVYEHFVATPVAIGAATNPTAMLTPLAVTIER